MNYQTIAKESSPSVLCDESYSGRFCFSTYVPAGDVAEFARTLDSAIAWCRTMQIQRVFLEVYRGGVTAATEDLRAARDGLQAAGIKASGGLTTTWGRGCGVPAVPLSGRFCLSSDATAQCLEHQVRVAASLFDELIFDDFYFTDCRCGLCEAGRGGGPWAPFRMNQFVALSKRLLAAAHETNRSCRVIIKYPQWYDRLSVRGYDVARESELFDAIWIGTETRDPHPGKGYNYIKESQSWIIYNWLRDVGGCRTLGGWFDTYGCDEPSYVEQCYQNVLVGAPEMVLFCFPSLRSPEAGFLEAALRRETPRMRHWAAALQGARPEGIACYLPPNASPVFDAYLLDYLVMIGLPAVPYARFPHHARQVFCSEAALQDPNIEATLREYLRGGGHVVATSNFVRGLSSTAAGDLFGIVPISPQAALRATTCIRWQDREIELARPMVLTGNLRPAGAQIIATAGDDAQAMPWLTRHTSGKAVAMMLDLCTGWMDQEAMNIKCEPPVLFLPPAVLEPLRQVLTAPLELEIHGPASVGVYCFPPTALAVCNYRDEPAELEIALTGKAVFPSLAGLRPQDGDEVELLYHTDRRIRVRLPARRGTLLQQPSPTGD